MRGNLPALADYPAGGGSMALKTCPECKQFMDSRRQVCFHCNERRGEGAPAPPEAVAAPEATAPRPVSPAPKLERRGWLAVLLGRGPRR
jgi:hypothetical protein